MASGKKTGGRKKGTPNKFTGEVKEMVLEALSESGGVEYLKTQAANNPTAFLSLVGKVIPLQVKGSGDKGEHVIKRVVEMVVVDAAA